MNRTWIFMIVVAYPLLVFAQPGSPGRSQAGRNSPPYQPAVPASSTANAYGGYGGWYGGSGGGTAAGSALNGMASAISAKGDYNLSTSAAAVNMTQAQKNEIENRQQWTNTYFDMRATNRAARDAERSPTPTMEQLARIARDGAPRPLSPSQMDPVSGRINWPTALQEASFAAQRTELEQLFASRARYGGLNYSDQMRVQQIIDSMFSGLKAQIQEIPPQDYVACRSLLQSLTYAATKSELQ
jgi:hypothetical protein